MEQLQKKRITPFYGSYESFLDFLLKDENFLKQLSPKDIEKIRLEKETLELVNLFQKLNNNGS